MLNKHNKRFLLQRNKQSILPEQASALRSHPSRRVSTSIGGQLSIYMRYSNHSRCGLDIEMNTICEQVIMEELTLNFRLQNASPEHFTEGYSFVDKSVSKFTRILESQGINRWDR